MKQNKKMSFFFLFFFFTTSCEDLFTRFKYETYECDKNPVKLKKIFIKNYEIGDIVEVEFENAGYELKILENNDSFMNLRRFDPKIEIKINKESSLINVNIKNHISNFECSNYVFKM
ncbi:MAG: hypothetical protein CL572_00135 [Alphaproteobacteria bacterium]|nr:hypothetical protein [Alphaproteobacteria bacterium]